LTARDAVPGKAWHLQISNDIPHFLRSEAMSATGLDVFDHTLQTTNIWLDDLMETLGWTERQNALHALRTVLHAVRDHLPVNDGAHFSAQLPLLVRGVFFEGWQPAKTPLKERSGDQFLARVNDSFLLDVEAEGRQIVAAVFRVLAKHVSAGEMEKVLHALPSGIRELASPEACCG
jgi:uncharacterized protein (DUF2267 family)